MANEDGAGLGGGLRDNESRTAPVSQEHPTQRKIDRAGQKIEIPSIGGGYVREQVGIPHLPGDVSEIRENVRREITKHILWTFNGFLLVTAIIILTTPITGVDITTVKEFFDPVLSAIIAIISAAIGFYFGKETATTQKTDAEAKEP